MHHLGAHGDHEIHRYLLLGTPGAHDRRGHDRDCSLMDGSHGQTHDRDGRCWPRR
jgi:hypothetical protein